ncbi:Chitin synthase activator (Chs3) [Penicillium chermesinum]|uniref:Chitin synthase activator (Chs3) n=1 Tax=Penicillium chermesinum TaxID=63820 RepID=A0A9W9NH01_9EURO|nr:Chitin synthase activator (Chs3) [Penicillium chermesinum]KAJ5219807.1 Chitin synthase activator (Chs3) [Penicillium chermesinum]
MCPPTDEQREANLDRARMAVLSTTDPEMQLAWAQDALAFVEVAAQNEARLSLTQPPRPHTPPVERQLKNDALNIVGFLAEQHHPKAEFLKGMWLEFGKFNYRVDRKEAFRCYTRAADKGYARAEYRIGMQFESSGEPEKAIKHYERGVTMGDSASYYRLGMMILLGQHGQRQDFARGLEYIRLAAQSCDQNAPQGAYVYGMLIARELPQVNVPESFLPMDYNIARVNIEKAAYHGFAKAQVKMGAAYELCQLGCDFNPALSLHYNALAARQGEPEAEMAISKWFLCGHEGIFEKNDELAFTYAQRAAQSGLPTAEFALGYFYEVGIFVAADLKEARSWYAKAEASGNRDATSRIDSISRSKTLSRKDHQAVAINRIKSVRHVAHQRGNSFDPAGRILKCLTLHGSLCLIRPRLLLLILTALLRALVLQASRIIRCLTIDQAPHLVSTQIFAPMAHLNRPGAYRPGPGSAPSSGPGTPVSAPPGPMSPQNMMSPNGTPRLDIGYSAPVPPPGDRRRPPRLEGAPPDRRPVRTPVGGPPGSAGPGGLASPRTTASPRPGGSPSSANFPNQGNFPPRTESRQPSRGSAASSVASGPSATTPGPRPPAQQQPSKPSAPPPGKGPKTFEEMGVPSAKSDNDCTNVKRSAKCAHLSSFFTSFSCLFNNPNMVRKPKADTGAASGDVALVLDYLRAQNRPFSVIEVSANLHNKVSKAKATKALQQLHEEGQIGGRTNGKQAVYHALQDAARSVTPQVLSTMNQEIEKLRTELADLKTSERKARMALAVFEANPRLSNLQEDIQRLEQERNGIREHLAILHDDNEVHLSPEERERLEREWEYWQSHATSRRRMCRDLWGRCTEVLPEGTSERELWGLKGRSNEGLAGVDATA